MNAPPSPPAVLDLGRGYALDTLSHRLSHEGRTVQLSPLASRLLQVLAQRPGEVVERSEIIAALWKGDWLVGDPALSRLVSESGRESGAVVHTGGTYVCMEGPQFSTLAESKLYRSWGADIIGMTNLQEAKLAREAEICYTTIALVTDYDCWHPDHDSVTVDMIIANLMQNARTAQHIIARAVEGLPYERSCECASALKYALITRPDAIPPQVRQDLAPLVGKYLQTT